MSIADYDWGLIWDYRRPLLDGLAVAIEVSITALAISIVGGMLLAIMRLSRPPLTWIALVYTNVFRGVPALVGVIWIYFGVSLILGVNFSVFQAGVIALVLLYSAYLTEIFRSALLAVPTGHREAGQALGMRPSRIFLLIILPQAIKIAIPNVGSMYIGMVKDTSVFTVIGLLEVVNVTQNLVSQTYQPFVLYTGAAVIYVLVAFAIDAIFRAVEGAYSIPPKGTIPRAVHSRHRRRIERLIREVGQPG